MESFKGRKWGKDALRDTCLARLLPVDSTMGNDMLRKILIAHRDKMATPGGGVALASMQPKPLGAFNDVDSARNSMPRGGPRGPPKKKNPYERYVIPGENRGDQAIRDRRNAKLVARHTKNTLKKLPVEDFLASVYGDDVRTIEGLTEKVFGEGMEPIKLLSRSAMLEVLITRPGMEEQRRKMAEQIAASEDTSVGNIMMSSSDEIENKYRNSLEDDSDSSFPAADVPKRNANGKPTPDTARIKDKKVKNTSIVESSSTSSSTMRDIKGTGPVSGPNSSKVTSPTKK